MVIVATHAATAAAASRLSQPRLAGGANRPEHVLLAHWRPEGMAPRRCALRNEYEVEVARNGLEAELRPRLVVVAMPPRPGPRSTRRWPRSPREGRCRSS